MKTLKACPFCGNPPKHWQSDDGKWHRIVCDNIFCTMSAVSTIIDTEEKVVNVWNTRKWNKE